MKGSPSVSPGGLLRTDDAHLLNAFTGYSCPGKHVHPVHQVVEGKYTKESELYTDKPRVETQRAAAC